MADYLFFNESEAAAMSMTDISSVKNAQEAAGSIATHYNAAVIVTLGERGALLAKGGVGWMADGYPVSVKDTQGAGDTFMGVFAAGLIFGMDPEQALLRANVAAALSVSRMGSAQHSYPDTAVTEEITNKLLRENVIARFNYRQS